MVFEYQVTTVGGSAFDNLERFGERLEDALNSADAVNWMEQGWELWQVNALNDSQGINGVVVIYRRPKVGA